MHSDVNIQLFTDDQKALTMFLVNRRYRFEEAFAARSARGDHLDDVPQIFLDVDDVTVRASRCSIVTTRGRPLRAGADAADALVAGARLADVEALLAR